MGPSRLWRNLDWLLLGLVAVAAAMGVVAVASVTGGGLGDPSVMYYGRHQLQWVVLGLIVLVVVASIDYHAWARWRRAIYGFAVLLLLVVLVLGHYAHGARRWISLGPFAFQPSEFAKLALVFWLAGTLASEIGEVRRWGQLVVPTLAAAALAALIAAEPDLGTSMVFCAILLGVAYVAGFPGHRLVLVLVAVVGLAVLAVVAHARWHMPIPLSNYQLARLDTFLNPQQDPQNNGWQVIQAEMAVGSGRLFGTGLFSGGVNGQLTYLSERQTDFVFASIGNVAGFIGACAVLAVLGLIVWRAIRTMVVARDGLGALLAGGIATMLAFQTLLNAGVALGMLPATGVPLPFFSYGGSSALVNFAAVGILQSVTMRRKKIQF